MKTGVKMRQIYFNRKSDCVNIDNGTYEMKQQENPS